MLAQIKVGAVGDTLEFAPAEGILVFDIRTGFGVVGELVLLVVVKAEVSRLDPEARGVPTHALLAPVVEPLLVSSRFDEELHFHLFELTRPEDKVAGRDLITEGFADL